MLEIQSLYLQDDFYLTNGELVLKSLQLCYSMWLSHSLQLQLQNQILLTTYAIIHRTTCSEMLYLTIDHKN